MHISNSSDHLRSLLSLKNSTHYIENSNALRAL